MLEQITVSYGIPLAYIALGIAAIGIIGFSVLQMVQDLKKAMIALVAIGILVVLFVVCFVLSANEPRSVGDTYVAAGQMRFVEAGIIMFYMQLAISAVAILYFTILRYFNK